MKVTDRVGGTGAMTLGVWKLRLSPTHPHAWIERGPRSIYHACFGTNVIKAGEHNNFQKMDVASRPAGRPGRNWLPQPREQDSLGPRRGSYLGRRSLAIEP